MRGTTTKQWFVRLGTQHIGDLADPGSKGRAPRVQSVRAVRRDFTAAITNMRQQTEAANRPQEEKEEESKEGETDEEGMRDCHESDLLLLRVQRMLLPLLVKEEVLNQDSLWAPNVDSASVGAAIDSVGKELRQHREDALSSVLGTEQVPISAETEENDTVVPTLKKHGVNPKDKQAHESPLRDLRALNKKRAKSSTLHCTIRDNLTSAFVCIPSSKDFVGMKQNARKAKWLPDVLTAPSTTKKAFWTC